MKKGTAEARFLAPDEPGELQLARTEGSFVFDEKGRRYIDFMMGLCVGNFGWGNAVLVKEAKTFRGPDYVHPGYSYAPWAELAKLLVSIAPLGGFDFAIANERLALIRCLNITCFIFFGMSSLD